MNFNLTLMRTSRSAMPASLVSMRKVTGKLAGILSWTPAPDKRTRLASTPGSTLVVKGLEERKTQKWVWFNTRKLRHLMISICKINYLLPFSTSLSFSPIFEYLTKSMCSRQWFILVCYKQNHKLVIRNWSDLPGTCWLAYLTSTLQGPSSTG